ncbi:ATP-binding protein [Chitinimonas sp. BJB300]|uniref:ATP-binding protein n=1 Tax=Chitinimonas sp. BJB300 TaxID=1559339 RepID=UPI00117EA81A|nr:ATP-binding protein [Chitinimonas sp. BJB300]TSJ91370.1 HAMP domain-containing histidine kinase [Chitinimonas sp. BJB300]
MPHNALVSVLHRLVLLRAMTITAYVAAVLFAVLVFRWALPLLSLGFVCLALMAYNLLSLLRLRLARKQGYAITAAEIARQLSIDIIGHGLWLFFIGGASNPFTALFLLPLVIAAATLPARFVWPLTGLTLLTYSILLVWYLPLPLSDDSMAQAFFLHTLGMWLAFVAAALIVAGLVTRIGQQLRSQERELADAREAGLRHQQVLGLGLQAAGAAHRLGTPLATMTVLVDELRDEHVANTSLSADLDLIRQQLYACRAELGRLRADCERPASQPADKALRALMDDWRVVRPTAQTEVVVLGTQPPVVTWAFDLRQALLNLLDNAADASAAWQRVSLDWTAHKLQIRIEDQGPGFDGVVVEPGGRGLGMGVALAVSAVERCGGRVVWQKRAEGGTAVDINLPLAEA